MSKNIVVSTDVFAAIWGIRKLGEDSEDAILRRIFKCKQSNENPEDLGSDGIGGVYDYRNQIDFPCGFEVFRNYKNRLYKATAIDGAWQRTDNGKRYPTLNQLNSSIVSGNENVWNGNWKYRDENRVICSVNYMREHQAEASV